MHSAFMIYLELPSRRFGQSITIQMLCRFNANQRLCINLNIDWKSYTREDGNQNNKLALTDKISKMF